MRLIQVYLSDLKELLQNQEFQSVRRVLEEVSPIDLVDGWEHFTSEEREVLFRLAPRQRAIQLFEELDTPYQEELLKGLESRHLEELFRDLDPAEAGRVVRELPQKTVRQLLGLMKKGELAQAQKYLEYPARTVGSAMRSRFVPVDSHWTCKQALERIQASTRLHHIEDTHLDTLFVVDAEMKLKGQVGLKQLVVAPPDLPISELARKPPYVFRPEMDQEVAARLFTHYKLKSGPVADSQERLLGILLSRDIFEIVQEETEEDFAKMAGAAAGALEAKGALESARFRFPWLAVTCIGQLLVSAVIRGFEHTLAQVIALATFMPFIAAMGGNIGSQSAILVVRALSMRELKEEDVLQTVKRDFGVGVLLGALYGAVLAGVAQALYGVRFGWRFSVVVGAGAWFSMTVAAALGSLVPFLFQKLKIDPATATGPLVTTATDLLSTSSYLALATYLLLAG